MTGSQPFPSLPDELQRAIAAEGDLADEQRARLADLYFAKIDTVTSPLVEVANTLRANSSMKARAMRKQERSTHVFHRGDFLQPDKDSGEVIPGTPASLPAMHGPDSRKPNRLDLAHWLVAPRNPLTSRVAANDIWARLFGVGLVDTKGDWGTRCAPPLHQELLDHLADSVVDGGWSRKALIREIG